jgi:hypothetical protein
MTITLPDDVRAQAERQATAAGFATVADYLADLVREDAEDADWSPPPTCISTAEELRAAVAVGLASPPVASVDEMFAKLRRIASGGAE